MRHRADHVAVGSERVAQGANGIGGALDLWPGGSVPGCVGRDGCGAFGAKGLERDVHQRWQGKRQGLVEYAMILALVAIVVVVALAGLGQVIGNIFSDIVENI